jgi:hypothetical protein
MIDYWMLHKIKGVCKNHIENLKNSSCVSEEKQVQ